MVTELDFIKAQPPRVLEYLHILARCAASLEEELQLTPSKEDLLLARERAMREKLDAKIEDIDKNVSKTLYKIHNKLNRVKHLADNNPPKAKKGKTQIAFVRDPWLIEHEKTFAQVHKLKQKIRLLEEKYFWLANKGYDSKRLALIQQRITKAKEVLYHRLDSALGSVPSRELKKVPKSTKQSLSQTVIGNMANHKYHKVNCRFARTIEADNKVVFESIDDAKKKKFSACGVCFKKR